MKQLDNYIVKILAQEIAFNWRIPFAIEGAHQAIGTGFFIDSHGLILTCGHVLEKSVKVFVEIPADGFKRYDADIVGFCPSDQLDIGLIRLRNYKSKYYLKLGDSNKLKRGMRVLAVGFPLGQSYLKYTEGIVSGFQDGIIQTDTAINPGNSGGPLIYDEKVVGIIVSKMTEGENVGFAVPIAQYYPIAERLLQSLHKKGIRENRLERIPRLGLEYNETDNKIRRHFGSKCKEGIYIAAVYPEAPIAKTGMKAGAILCSFDGNKVDSNGLIQMQSGEFKVDIYNYCKFLPLNKLIKVEWYYKGKRQTGTFRLAPYILPIHVVYPVYEPVEYMMIGGIILMDMTINHIPLFPNKLAKYVAPIERINPKIIIVSILPGSSASKSDILGAGDVIVKVNDVEVGTVANVRKIIETLGVSDIVLENDAGNIYITDKKTMEDEVKMIGKIYKLTL